MDQATPEMKKWVDFAKSHKAVAVNCTDRGDITPTVIVEKDGEVLAVVSAPDVDKHQGLFGANMCRLGFDPDHLTILLDAHIRKAEPKEGMTEEEYLDEYHKKFPKGMQHACDNDGACATDEISDCLICHRIDRAGNIEMVILPYAYHGKDGPEFRWVENDKYKPEVFKNDGDGANGLKGLIPEALQEIMAKKASFDEMPFLKELAQKMDFTEERTRFHIARATLYMLAEKGFVIKDFVTNKHPEWVDAENKAKDHLKQIIKQGILPREAEPILMEIIEQHMGKKTFQDEFANALKERSYWLPRELRGDEENFAIVFERNCMAPSFPGAGRGPRPKRVRVWNGDQSEYLGEGDYVGEATVYFVRNDDGTILSSNQDAETEPDPETLPEGARVMCSENNPKIKLDSGEIVYGCQVWWESVEEPQGQHQEFGGWNKPKAKS